MSKEKQFLITDKRNNSSQVVTAIDKHHARARGESIFNTSALNIKVKTIK